MPTANSRVSVLDDVGDQFAPPGSEPWARWFIGQAKLRRHDLQRDVAGLQKIIKKLEKGEAWKVLGFLSMEALCQRELDLDGKQVDLIRKARAGTTLEAVIERAKEAKPLEEHGNQEGENNSRNRVGNSKSVSAGGTTADYLTARIARDRPDVLERMKAGEFSSVRQAGIAAGIVKVPTRMEAAKKAVMRLTDAERLELVQWIDAMG